MKDQVHVHLPRGPFSQLQQALPPTFFRPSSMLASWGGLKGLELSSMEEVYRAVSNMAGWKMAHLEVMFL